VTKIFFMMVNSSYLEPETGLFPDRVGASRLWPRRSASRR